MSENQKPKETGAARYWADHRRRMEPVRQYEAEMRQRTADFAAHLKQLEAEHKAEQTKGRKK